MVYWFPVAAVTNNHTFSGLVEARTYYLCSSVTRKSERAVPGLNLRCWQGCIPS